VSRKAWWISGLAAVALALLIVRALLPIWVADSLNRQLAEIQAYDARLEEVDLKLYRGAYRVHELRFEPLDAEDDLPLLHFPTIDLSVSWRHIFRGALVGEVEFDAPVFNIVDREQDDGVDTVETGGDDDRDWRDYVEDFFPLQIDEMRVKNGTIAFINLWSDPQVDVRLVDINGTVSNLTNIRDEEGRREAELHARARMLGESPLDFSARFDPWGELDDFYLALRVTEIDLTKLNDLARAYLNLDFASGHGDFVMELEAFDNRLQGYAKPLLHELEIFDLEQHLERDGLNPLQLVWEGIAELVTLIFRNHPKDRFATRVSIEGDLDDPELSTLEAVIGVLRNAFGDAIEAHFEGEGAPDEDEQ
jgi:hypothetical protein